MHDGDDLGDDMGDDGGWYDEATATFGDRLGAAREAAGLSRADLARRMGVRPQTVAGWEDDRAEPRANKLQKLAGVLNVSLSWLLTGQGAGIAPPDEAGTPATPDLRAALAEIRALRDEITRAGARLARLEQALRLALEKRS